MVKCCSRSQSISQALARKVAEEGAVLLKNESHVLPVESGKVKSIDVIGDDAGPHVTIGLNGSGHVYATKGSVPVDAIRERAGDAIKVTYAQDSIGIGPLPAIPDCVLKPESGEGNGFLARYFDSADANGLPVVSRTEPCLENVGSPPPEFFEALDLTVPVEPKTVPPPGPSPKAAGAKPSGKAPPPSPAMSRRVWSARWTGVLTPDSSGSHLFSITGSGTAQLYVDNKVVATMMRADFGQTVQGTIVLHSGHPAESLPELSVIERKGNSQSWPPKAIIQTN
jgi:beta-glucosidase